MSLARFRHESATVFVASGPGPADDRTGACYGDPKAAHEAADPRCHVQIRIGYELKYTFTQPTPVILTLTVHHSRAGDLLQPDRLSTDPAIPTRAYRDGFGNWCTRL